jgi:hypothetical protein
MEIEMKLGFTVTAVLLLGAYAAPALALQGLCVISPENPTAILGLLGAGAAGYPYLRQRLKDRAGRRRGRDVGAD